MDGEIAPVNGYDFEGPGVIIREWPLRGVAICPYGADANTESAALSTGPSFAATRWTAKTEGESEMKTAETVDAQVETEAPVAVEKLTVDAEVEAVKEPVTELATEVVTTDPVEAAPVVTETEMVTADAVRAQLAAVEANHAQATESLTAITAEHDVTVAELRTTAEALNTATTELVELRAQLAAIEKGAPPVSATPAPEGSELTAWQKAQLKNK